MSSIRKLVGSTLVDVETNVNGFTALYFENEKGEKYSVDLCPVIRKLEKETAPEVPVQEQSNKNNAISEIINVLISKKVLLNEANIILEQVKKLLPTYYQFFGDEKGEKYLVDLYPLARNLEKETAPEIPVQEPIINIASNNDKDISNEIKNKIEAFILSYTDYVQESTSKAKQGLSIDEKAIYALGDAVRVIHHINKIMKDLEK